MLYVDEIDEFIEIVENEFDDDVEILDNSIENNVALKSNITAGLFIEIMNDNYDVDIEFDDVVEFVKLNDDEYLFIIEFNDIVIKIKKAIDNNIEYSGIYKSYSSFKLYDEFDIVVVAEYIDDEIVDELHDNLNKIDDVEFVEIYDEFILIKLN